MVGAVTALRAIGAQLASTIIATPNPVKTMALVLVLPTVITVTVPLVSSVSTVPVPPITVLRTPVTMVLAL